MNLLLKLIKIKKSNSYIYYIIFQHKRYAMFSQAKREEKPKDGFPARHAIVYSKYAQNRHSAKGAHFCSLLYTYIHINHKRRHATTATLGKREATPT